MLYQQRQIARCSPLLLARGGGGGDGGVNASAVCLLSVGFTFDFEMLLPSSCNIISMKTEWRRQNFKL